MSRAVSLSTLRARVREVADLGADTTSGRYPNARLNREINQSWQRQREIATTQGDGLLYLKQTSPANMTAGVLNSNSSFGTIPMPADCVSVHGVDVVFSTSDICSLQPMSWQDRNSFRDIYGGSVGRPVGFCPYNIGLEGTNTITAGLIAILPAPDAAYSYTIWYLPILTDRTNDTDVFDGIAGHDDWTVWDTVLKIAAGDNDMQNVVAIAKDERAAAEALLTARVNRIQRAGPRRRRDVSGQQRQRYTMLWRRPV